MRYLIFFLILGITVPTVLNGQQPVRVSKISQLPKQKINSQPGQADTAKFKLISKSLATRREPQKPEVDAAITKLEVGHDRDLPAVIDQLDDYAATDNDALFGLGLAYADLGDYDRAEEFFIRILEKNPLDADAWYALGVLYDHLGLDEAAQGCWEAVMEIDPEYPLEGY